MIARFSLTERSGVTSGRVTLVLDDGATTVVGIGVDLLALARNDPGAFRFPLGSGVDDADAAQFSARLLPHLRMLTRGRVIPLTADLEF